MHVRSVPNWCRVATMSLARLLAALGRVCGWRDIVHGIIRAAMEPGPPRPATRGRRRPIFSEPSVLPKENAPDSSCPPATARPWPCISWKSRLRSRQEHMRSFFSIRQDGMFPGSCRCPATLPSRVEPSRKYLAVHPRQLALEPGFQILRRHPRSLLLRLEQAYDGIYRISFAPCAM